MKKPWPLRKPMILSKIATLFAVAFVLAFGLCTATISVGVNGTIGLSSVIVAFGIEAICAIGLVVIGLIALFRSRT